MTFERLNLGGQVANVKEFQQVIPGRGQQPIAVHVPLQLHHGVLVGVSMDREGAWLCK